MPLRRRARPPPGGVDTRRSTSDQPLKLNVSWVERISHGSPKDVTGFFKSVVGVHEAGELAAHHHPAAAFSTRPTSTAVASKPSMKVTRPFCLQYGVVESCTRAGLAAGEAKHHSGGDGRPDDAEGAMAGVVTGGENDHCLNVM